MSKAEQKWHSKRFQDKTSTLYGCRGKNTTCTLTLEMGWQRETVGWGSTLSSSCAQTLLQEQFGVWVTSNRSTKWLQRDSGQSSPTRVILDEVGRWKLLAAYTNRAPVLNSCSAKWGSSLDFVTLKNSTSWCTTDVPHITVNFCPTWRVAGAQWQKEELNTGQRGYLAGSWLAPRQLSE